MEATVEKYHKQLLEQAQFIFFENPISETAQNAYSSAPRHLFVKRYREMGTKYWREVNEDNIEEHLAMLYADRALILFGEDDEDVPSTISQPSFVLRMLDMLQIDSLEPMSLEALPEWPELKDKEGSKSRKHPANRPSASLLTLV